MHRLVRDALNTALQKLGFPWLTPHPTKTSREIGYFQKSITPDDLYGMYKRNQIAHSIVFDVAYDALAARYEMGCSTYLLTYLRTYSYFFSGLPFKPRTATRTMNSISNPRPSVVSTGTAFVTAVGRSCTTKPGEALSTTSIPAL